MSVWQVERITLNDERKHVCKDAGIRHYVMLNLVQHLTASLSSSSPRTDPEICDLARAEPNLLELCRA